MCYGTHDGPRKPSSPMTKVQVQRAPVACLLEERPWWTLKGRQEGRCKDPPTPPAQEKLSKALE